MKTTRPLWVTGLLALALALPATRGLAQPNATLLTAPNRLQRQAENLRIALGVTNDADWNVISPRLVRVIQLQAAMRVTSIATMGGGGATRALAALGVAADPAADELSKAIDDGAPIAEIKLDMAKVRQARKNKLADLARAQADLQAVVTIRQEAILLSNGLLD